MRPRCRDCGGDWGVFEPRTQGDRGLDWRHADIRDCIGEVTLRVDELRGNNVAGLFRFMFIGAALVLSVLALYVATQHIAHHSSEQPAEQSK